MWPRESGRTNSILAFHAFIMTQVGSTIHALIGHVMSPHFNFQASCISEITKYLHDVLHIHDKRCNHSLAHSYKFWISYRLYGNVWISFIYPHSLLHSQAFLLIFLLFQTLWTIMLPHINCVTSITHIYGSSDIQTVTVNLLDVLATNKLCKWQQVCFVSTPCIFARSKVPKTLEEAIQDNIERLHLYLTVR